MEVSGRVVNETAGRLTAVDDDIPFACVSASLYKNRIYRALVDDCVITGQDYKFVLVASQT